MSDDRWFFTRQTDGEFLDVLSIDNSTTIRRRPMIFQYICFSLGEQMGFLDYFKDLSKIFRIFSSI